MEKFKVVIVEDVKLELKGTEEIFRHEIPNAEIIGTAMTEEEFWKLMETCTPDMVLLDLGLGGSTTIGVEICSRLHRERPELKVLIFTGEVQIMTQMGPLPISFDIPAASVAEAVSKYGEAAKEGVRQTLERLQEMRSEAASKIVTPGSPGFGVPPSSGKIQMP